MHPLFQHDLLATRRQFFGHTGVRLGTAALASLAAETALRAPVSAADASGAVHPALPGFPHFPPKAKAVIYLHMNEIGRAHV